MRSIDGLIGADLAQRVLASPIPAQQDVGLAAATAAQLATSLVDPLLDEARDDLLHDNPTAGMRMAVEAVRDHLDDLAWELEARTPEGAGHDPAYMLAFQRARAAAAVLACLGPHAHVAANESVYEAAHATGRDARLGQLVSAVLTLLRPGGNHWASCELARLFWPHFTFTDDYVLLDRLHPDNTLEGWRARYPTEPARVEDVMNHVHLEDVAADRISTSAIANIGEQIATAWRSTLQAQYGPKRMIVELSGTILTAYSAS